MNDKLRPVDKTEELPGAAGSNTLGIDGLSTQPNSQSSSSQSSSENAPPPIEFGRYRLLRELGAGGMGTVYLAEDTELDRKVALKLPHFGNAAKVQTERFRREARLSAILDHPNICRIFDIGEHQGRLYLTMAFIEGRSLHDLVRSKGALEPKVAVNLVRGLATTVAYAHAQRIVHRDLKPANIMITKDRNFVIMDFGLARRVEQEEEQITATGAVLGTPAYMAPEQLRGEGDSIGTHSDVYSLGIILYELLVGNRPFQGTIPQIYSQVLASEAVAPSPIEHKLDPELCAICAKATHANIAKRFQSASDLATALSQYLARPSGGTAAAASSHKPVAADHEGRVEDFIATRKRIQPKRSWQFAAMIGCGLSAAVLLCISSVAMLTGGDRQEDIPRELAASEPSSVTGLGKLPRVNQPPAQPSPPPENPTSIAAAQPSAVPPASTPQIEIPSSVPSTDYPPTVPQSPIEQAPVEPPMAALPNSPSSVVRPDGRTEVPAATMDNQIAKPDVDFSRRIRSWKSMQGNFSVDAIMASHTDTLVTLEKADGKQVSVPITKLSDEDQRYIKTVDMLDKTATQSLQLEPFLQRLFVNPRAAYDEISAIQKKSRDPVTSLYCGAALATEGGKAGLVEACKQVDIALLELRNFQKLEPGLYASVLACALNNRAVLCLREGKNSRVVGLFKELASTQDLPDYARHNIQLLLAWQGFKLSDSERKQLVELVVGGEAASNGSFPAQRFVYSTNFKSMPTPISSGDRLVRYRQQGVWPELSCLFCEATGVLNCPTCADGTVAMTRQVEVGKNHVGQPYFRPEKYRVPCPNCSGKGGSRCDNCRGTGRIALP